MKTMEGFITMLEKNRVLSFVFGAATVAGLVGSGAALDASMGNAAAPVASIMPAFAYAAFGASCAGFCSGVAAVVNGLRPVSAAAGALATTLCGAAALALAV